MSIVRHLFVFLCLVDVSVQLWEMIEERQRRDGRTSAAAMSAHRELMQNKWGPLCNDYQRRDGGESNTTCFKNRICHLVAIARKLKWNRIRFFTV